MTRKDDVLRGGRAVLAETLRTIVYTRVGERAGPAGVEFSPSLPAAESGKIQRALLRRQAAEASGG